MILYKEWAVMLERAKKAEAERDRLLAVVEAAREFKKYRTPPFADSLYEALAALDGDAP